LQVVQILPEPACHNKIARRDGSTFATGNLEFQNLSHFNQTAQNPQHPNIPRRCDRNARHSRALVRHVERLGGPVIYLCRPCWWQVVATEARAVLVAQWNRLFDVRPRAALGLGGVVQAFAEACTGVCTGGCALIGADGRGGGL